MRATKNVDKALAALGARREDVVQCNWVVSEAEYFETAGRLLRQYFSETKPAMMTLVASMIDPRMKFEVQVTAMLTE